MIRIFMELINYYKKLWLNNSQMSLPKTWEVQKLNPFLELVCAKRFLILCENLRKRNPFHTSPNISWITMSNLYVYVMWQQYYKLINLLGRAFYWGNVHAKTSCSTHYFPNKSSHIFIPRLHFLFIHCKSEYILANVTSVTSISQKNIYF